MIVEMIKKVKDQNMHVLTLIEDDDSTGFNKARAEVMKNMDKVSDTNHVKKNITNQLFKLKPKYKELTIKAIHGIMKSFNYMLAQSKCEADTIRRNLPAVVYHQFGIHSDCATWCRMKAFPTSKHRNLPWGADLISTELKEELLKIFMKLDVNKLAKLDSTNRNENFNNIVRSKAPKDKHYSESISLQDRLAAAVCQKNDGYGYVPEVKDLHIHSLLLYWLPYLLHFWLDLKPG